MHTKSFAVAAAIALASSTVVEANRPRIYFPRQIRREFGNNATITASEEQAAPESTLANAGSNKRESLSDFMSSIFGEDTNSDDKVNSGLNRQRLGATGAAPPALILQPTSSIVVEDPETTVETVEPTVVASGTDTGILLAPSGIVTTTNKQVAQPTSEAPVSEPKKETEKETTAEPVESNPAPVSSNPEPAQTTEQPKENTETQAAPSSEKSAVDPVESVVTSVAPVETETQPAVIETQTQSAAEPAETPTQPPAVETQSQEPEPVQSETKKPETQPKESQAEPIDTKTEEPAPETTKPAETQPAETKPETSAAPVQSETKPSTEPKVFPGRAR